MLSQLLTLTGARGIGSVRYERLLGHFGSLPAVLKAGETALAKVPGIGPEIAREIRQSVTEARGEKELQRATKDGITILTADDPAYPAHLRTIYDYPLILYVKGKIAAADEVAVALVGSRRASYYGKRQAELLAYDLVIRGICVVSGLARGIDTAAHQGALKAKGRTIAVLGSGLNRIYPAENKKLAEKIAESGALVSELPLDTPPDSRNFPVRNRIISGLSAGVVVVEAPRKSGALITAHMALDQGREVFAVPGKIDSLTSHGCHHLIKQGAKLVENVEDILEELPVYLTPLNPALARKEESAPTGLNWRQETILNLLSKDEPRHIDDLIVSSNLTPPMASVTLLELELKRYVRQLPGKNFIRLV